MSQSDARARRGRSTIARHGRLRKRGPVGTIVKVLASTVAVVVVSSVAVVGYAAWDLSRSAKPVIHLVGEKTSGPVPDIGTYPGGVNLLLAGVDTRTGQGGNYGSLADSSGPGNNDVTMLLHVAADHKSATVVSFPRDLMVPIPECPDGQGGMLSARSKSQFNTTLAEGGLACTVLAVQSLVDDAITIPFAADIKFNGVIAMANAVGGVQVCVASRIDDDLVDPELHMDPGTYTLKGAQALSFLRTREGVGDGSDLGRISNQQVYLSALVRTVKDGGTLTNPAKVWGVANAALKNMEFSASLNNLTTVYQIAMLLKDIDLDKMVFVQYPVFADPDDSNRVVPDYDSAAVLFNALKNDRPIQLGGTVGRGAVVSTNAPTVPDASATTAPPTGSTTSPPSTTSTSTAAPDGTAVTLPDNIQGQSASTTTCSKGN
ncbi:LCP family protein [Leifsonia sp. Root112D2]|uniref:LCP family protein n=1 Tax=Leifsonia sp. Root112D2 TaxID=1736426 RepID=UPI0006FB65D4|nr:LCP family protein [Leifsonia sp. Root112D2]KQV06425.1 hypothetical protein ASC63_02965 [Leifsonia sp. Root112D2]